MIWRLRIIPFFLLFLNISVGQTPASLSKEQLYGELNKTLSDSSRQDYYNQLGKTYIDQSWKQPVSIDSAFFFLRKAVYLGDSANVAGKEITNKTLYLLGAAYFRVKDFGKGIKLFEQVITNYRKTGDKVKEADTRVWRGRYLVFFDVYPELAEDDYRKAVSAYAAAGNNLKRIDAVLQIAAYYSGRDKFSLADSTYQVALKDAEKNKGYRLQEIYTNLSAANRYEGDFNRALKYSLEAVKIIGPSGVDAAAANCYGELALVYQELDQPLQSIFWYRKCLEIRSKIPTEWAIFFTAYLMTAQMIKAGQTGQAIGFLDSLARTTPPRREDEKASFFRGLAHCYFALKDYPRSEKYFLAMMKENYQQNNAEVLMIDNYDVGKFYADTRQYKKAKPFLDKAGELSATSTAPRVMDLQYMLFKVDSADGDLEKAIRHLHRYHAINDSIFGEAKTKQIQELLIKYEAEKKDRDIRLLENERKVERGELTRANQTKNWIFGVAGLFLVIIGLLINNARVKQRANKKLHSQQEEIEKKNLVLEHLVKEKEWLVKEIHHRVKNNFHIVVGLLGTQSQYLKTEEAIKAVTESQHRVQAMSLIHQKLYQSENMSAINMVGYIHDLIGHLRHSFNIRQSILFRIEVDPIELGISHSVPLGLIVNEAVTNSIKYAFPDNREGMIFVSLTQYPDSQYVLLIRDNGCGLPAGFNLSNLSSMGVRLMRGLTEDMWGRFTIGGVGGTEIRIEFSLENEDKTGFSQSMYNSTITT